MSTRSKIVLGVSCVVSVGIIFGVHYKQQLDRERMHQGVVRDMEVQEMKKRQNMVLLDQQTALTQLLRDQEKSRDLK
ncbi:Protein PET117-like protein, mitochondrial [Frankliniella fusca]|uniref:Protein PET117-like protein, mitochondrial n=1 Tax=Frankliniella fusca TaxID=407009 RepID=A0AAE1LCT4_9NEOP|nr:Protein PET117-like protein, mitochondrial [Frankliniella fusca]